MLPVSTQESRERPVEGGRVIRPSMIPVTTCVRGELVAERRVGNEAGQSSGKRVGVTGREEPRLTFAENLGDATDAGGDDRDSGSHGIDEYEREGLIRGEDRNDINRARISRHLLRYQGR